MVDLIDEEEIQKKEDEVKVVEKGTVIIMAIVFISV